MSLSFIFELFLEDSQLSCISQIKAFQNKIHSTNPDKILQYPVPKCNSLMLEMTSEILTLAIFLSKYLLKNIRCRKKSISQGGVVVFKLWFELAVNDSAWNDLTDVDLTKKNTRAFSYPLLNSKLFKSQKLSILVRFIDFSYYRCYQLLPCWNEPGSSALPFPFHSVFYLQPPRALLSSNFNLLSFFRFENLLVQRSFNLHI